MELWLALEALMEQQQQQQQKLFSVSGRGSQQIALNSCSPARWHSLAAFMCTHHVTSFQTPATASLSHDFLAAWSLRHSPTWPKQGPGLVMTP
jgi:hypothetical protein